MAVVIVFHPISFADCQFGDACLFAYVSTRVDFFLSFEGQLQYLWGIGGFVGVSALKVIECDMTALM